MERYENWIRSELNQAKGSEPSDNKPKVEQEVKSEGSGKEVSVPSGVPLTRQVPWILSRSLIHLRLIHRMMC